MLVRREDEDGEAELLPWQREWVVKGELLEIWFMLGGALCVGWGMYAGHAMLGWNLLRDKQGKPEAEGLYLFFAIFFSVAGFWPARAIPKLIGLRKRGQFAKGTIVRKWSRRWATVAFEVDGKRYRHQDSVVMDKRKGDRVEVLYDPQRPRRCVVVP